MAPIFTGSKFGFGRSAAAAAEILNSFTIYLWGASADNRSTTLNIKAGFTEVTIEKSSIPETYTRFEVIVGQEGVDGNNSSTRFGGGGGGAPQGGSPGGGGTFIFLSSPGSTQVFANPGTSLNVPVPVADGRCVAVAGGSGGRDIYDNTSAPGGGGLALDTGFSYSSEQTLVTRANGNPGYIGQNGAPGSPYSSGGGGGGFAAGMTEYDYSGWGGSGFAGQNTVSPQPFTGTSPVNGLVYTLGNTLSPSGSTGWTAPSGAAPYRPALAATPIDNAPQTDARGYVVIIDNSTGSVTQLGYTGGVQFYNFP